MTIELADIYTSLFDALERLDQQLEGLGCMRFENIKKAEMPFIHLSLKNGRGRYALPCNKLVILFGASQHVASLPSL